MNSTQEEQNSQLDRGIDTSACQRPRKPKLLHVDTMVVRRKRVPGLSNRSKSPVKRQGKAEQKRWVKGPSVHVGGHFDASAALPPHIAPAASVPGAFPMSMSRAVAAAKYGRKVRKETTEIRESSKSTGQEPEALQTAESVSGGVEAGRGTGTNLDSSEPKVGAFATRGRGLRKGKETRQAKKPEGRDILEAPRKPGPMKVAPMPSKVQPLEIPSEASGPGSGTNQGPLESKVGAFAAFGRGLRKGKGTRQAKKIVGNDVTEPPRKRISDPGPMKETLMPSEAQPLESVSEQCKSSPCTGTSQGPSVAKVGAFEARGSRLGEGEGPGHAKKPIGTNVAEAHKVAELPLVKLGATAVNFPRRKMGDLKTKEMNAATGQGVAIGQETGALQTPTPTSEDPGTRNVNTGRRRMGDLKNKEMNSRVPPEVEAVDNALEMGIRAPPEMLIGAINSMSAFDITSQSPEYVLDLASSTSKSSDGDYHSSTSTIESQQRDLEECDPAQDSRNDGLAVALPVSERFNLDLPQAQQMGSEAPSGPSEPKKNAFPTGVGFCALMGLCLLALISVPLGVAMSMRGNNKSNGTDNISQPKEDTVEDNLTREDYILSLLPEFSVAAIDLELEDTQTSAQTEAFLWVIDDPFLEDYEDWRIVQRFALATFYYACGGDSWYDATDWLSYDVEEYDWYMPWIGQMQDDYQNDAGSFLHDLGIESEFKSLFKDSGEGLEHFWMFNNNLQGKIPPELYLLTSLKIIDFGSNIFLDGTIASTIGNLQNIVILNMNFAGLTGSIPSQVGKLQNAVFFSFNDNRLTGRIPSEVGMMKNLWEVDVRANTLSGSIPTEVGSLDRLVSLNLGTNSLVSTIPSEIGRLSSARLIDLRSNKLSGTIPTELSLIGSNRNFDLYKEQVAEIVHGFDYLGDVVNMIFEEVFPYKAIVLNGNQFVGSVPPELRTMTSMDYVCLDFDLLSGSVQGDIRQMTSLEWLDHPENQIGRPISSESGMERACLQLKG